MDTSYMKLWRRILIALLTAALLAATTGPAVADQSTSVLPSWAVKSTIYEVNVRQYSAAGDFKSVTQSLPRLKRLGVGILWLMPIHPISKVNGKGTLGSPYSVADYKGINPDFGNAEEFHSLINSAHRLGMKVIIDWVPNHSGWDNPWITNESWYHRDANGKIISPNNDWTDVAWLDYENPQMRAAMIDAMKYWVTDFDIDGFRADVAGAVPVNFWDSANAELQKIKPLFMLAEEQGTMGMLNKTFVSNYNWELKDRINATASGLAIPISFMKFVSKQSSKYPTGSFPMNFITNHDENSWSGSEYKRLGAAVPAMAALTFTLPGIPLIYSGQEVGNTRELAFFEKDLIPNIEKENSTTAFYKKLVALKTKNPALWNSAPFAAPELIQANENIISFYRVSGKNKVLTIINASNSSQKTSISLKNLTGVYYQFSSNKKTQLAMKLNVTLKPWQFEIYSSAGN
jgi:glycosidase